MSGNEHGTKTGPLGPLHRVGLPTYGQYVVGGAAAVVYAEDGEVTVFAPDHRHELGAPGICVREAATDGRTVVVGAFDMEEGAQLRCARWQGDGYAPWESIDVAVDCVGARTRALAVSGHTMAISAVHREYGTVQVVQWDGERWVEKAQLRVSDADETYFGEAIALDASDERVLVAVTSWRGPHLYELGNDALVEIPLVYERSSNDRFRSIDVFGDLLVTGSPDSGDHQSPHGWLSGSGVHASGKLLVFERVDGQWKRGVPLKGSNKRSQGGVEYDELGSAVAAGPGWVVGGGEYRKDFGNGHFEVFLRDEQGFFQAYREDDYAQPRGFSSGIFAHRVGDDLVMQHPTEALTTLPRRSRVGPRPTRLAMVDGVVPEQARRMRPLVQLADGTVLSVKDDAIVVVGPDGSFQGTEGPHGRGLTLVSCGDRVLVDTDEALRWRRPDGRLAETGVDSDSAWLAGGPHGLAVLAYSNDSLEAALYDTELALLRRIPVPFRPYRSFDGSTDGDVLFDGRALFIGRPDEGVVYVCTGEEPPQELRPARAVKRFGGNLATDGACLYVGSGSGVHVFARDGARWVEETMVSVARNKKGSEAFVAVSDSYLAVSCTTKTGKVVVFARDDDGAWKRRHVFPGCGPGSTAFLRGEQLLLGMIEPAAPLLAYTL